MSKLFKVQERMTPALLLREAMAINREGLIVS
jgi:hypothetical protein